MLADHMGDTRLGKIGKRLVWPVEVIIHKSPTNS
jgi:hypothetical protein